MISGCRVLEGRLYDCGGVWIGEVTERAAVVLVREEPWITKLPKANPECALCVWGQHAGIAVCRNSIGITLDVIPCAMSKLAHQPGEKASERGNRSSINSADQRHHSINGKAVRDALRQVLCRQELRNCAVDWLEPIHL